MNLQEIFDIIIAGEEAAAEFITKQEYDSLRVMLTRKLAKYKEYMDSIGYLDDGIREAGLSGRFVSASSSAVFKLATKRATRTYQIVSRTSNVETETADVSADLAEDQECSSERGSTSEDSRLGYAASDPSSSQGEDCGRSNSGEDWNAD